MENIWKDSIIDLESRLLIAEKQLAIAWQNIYAQESVQKDLIGKLSLLTEIVKLHINREEDNGNA